MDSTHLKLETKGATVLEEPVEVLLVEDDPADMELTLRVLAKRHLANRIKVFRDGAEVLDFLFGDAPGTAQSLGTIPRLILLDLKLPKVDGIEVLARIKADPRTRSIPVVVLTSSSVDQDISRCYELGVNSYLVKPVDFEHFTVAVEQLGMYWLLFNQPRPERHGN